MDRIYHSYDKWEDFKSGFYDNISGDRKKLLLNKVVELFSNSRETEKYMRRVINEWKYSCEHNLTNPSINKIAYIGQAACCIYAGISSSITMEAWHLVSKENRDIADSIALKIIKEWEVKYA